MIIITILKNRVHEHYDNRNEYFYFTKNYIEFMQFLITIVLVHSNCYSQLSSKAKLLTV